MKTVEEIQFTYYNHKLPFHNFAEFLPTLDLEVVRLAYIRNLFVTSGDWLTQEIYVPMVRKYLESKNQDLEDLCRAGVDDRQRSLAEEGPA